MRTTRSVIWRCLEFFGTDLVWRLGAAERDRQATMINNSADESEVSTRYMDGQVDQDPKHRRHQNTQKQAKLEAWHKDFGLMLCVERATVDPSKSSSLDATRKPEEDDDGYRKRKEAVEHEIESLNKKRVSTRAQVQTIIKKLSNAKFLMTQNKVSHGSTADDTWYIRMGMKEQDLMIVAQDMCLMKKPKPFYLPKPSGKLRGTATEAGSLAYTIARAQGWADKNRNIDLTDLDSHRAYTSGPACRWARRTSGLLASTSGPPTTTASRH